MSQFLLNPYPFDGFFAPTPKICNRVRHNLWSFMNATLSCGVTNRVSPT